MTALVESFETARRSRSLPMALVLASGLAVYGLAPTTNGPVTCLLRLHADQACPGCGLSRAAGRLVRGDWSAAFGYHPYAFVLVAQLLGLAAWRWWWGGRPIGVTQVTRLVWLISANGAVLVALWLVRIVTGHLAHVY